MANQDPEVWELSPEVWEHIFQYLTVQQLKCVRLTCRRWRDIVGGSPRLMDKMELVWSAGDCLTSRFLNQAMRVKLDSLSFAPGNQWPTLGERLTELELRSYRFMMSDFLRVFRQTCNLKTLKIHSHEYTIEQDIVVDFHHDKIERLVVSTETGTTCLGVLGQICRRLKSFKLNARPDREPEYYELNVLNFIRSVQDTLEDVNCPITKYMQLEIAQLERLRLKKVRFSWHRKEEADNDSNIVAFCQKQTSIEELRVPLSTSINNQELSEIGRSLPGLRYLSCTISITGEILSFLASMPRIEYLDIYGENEIVNFTKFTNSNLKVLGIHEMSDAPNSLQILLEDSPNITSLTLEDCQFESLDELFAMLGQLELLRHLNLTYLTVQNQENRPCLEPLTGLTVLVVSDCYISSELLVTLFRQCSRLQKVYVCGKTINDDVLLTICQNSSQLKDLTIRCCRITDVSVQNIINYFHVLRDLYIVPCDNLSITTIKQLKSIERIRFRE